MSAEQLEQKQIIINRLKEDAVQNLLEGSDISCFCVMSSPKKTAFLLYRRAELEMYLGNQDVRQLFQKLGYKDFSLEYVLTRFRKRYEAHMNGEQQFPHEMGLLLGYPIEDVVGFMEHSGKEYLYSGYWKVYENVPIYEIYKKDSDNYYRERITRVS